MTDPKGTKEEDRALALGALIRRWRRERQLTLTELAAQVPMSASNLSRLELGSQRPPSDEVIERLATALDVDPADLLRVAGRHFGGESFEEAVMRRLDALQAELEAVRRQLDAG